MKTVWRWSVAVGSWCMAACGAGGGPDGGGSNLPSRGIAPWVRVGEAPVLKASDDAVWSRPSAIADADGIHVYFQAVTGGFSEIRRARAGLDGEMFGASETVLVGARAPGVTRDADGREWLAWVDDDGVVNIGTVDGAGQVELEVETGLIGSSPALMFGTDGELELFVINNDAVVRYPIRDGVVGAGVPAIGPGTDCVDNAGEAAECWDATAIVDVDVDLGTTAAGRDVWRMFYTARRAGTHAIGFAASYDGKSWSRYAFNPIITSNANARAPSAIVGDGRYLMYTDDRANSGIGLFAITPEAMSETW